MYAMYEMNNVSGDGQYTVENLLENTAYAIRVASRNAAGLSDYTPIPDTVRTQKADVTLAGTRHTSSCIMIVMTSIYFLFTSH